MESSDFESQPETQPAGSLEPPRRRPPTAIGAGTLPPRRPPSDPNRDAPMPEDDGEPYPEGLNTLRRVALRLLALCAFIAAAAMLWPLGWRGYGGAAAVVLCCVAWARAGSRPDSRADTRASEDARRRSA
jgi:hypothetical protein